MGAWKGEKSVTLIRMRGEAQLELRGQDAASVWDARCERQKPHQFVCVGSGEEPGGGKLFIFRSTMQFNAGGIEENWTVEDGRPGAKAVSGADLLQRMVPPSVR